MGKMKGLGRGLDSIFVDNAVEEETGSGVRTLRMAEIDPKADQPRRNFDAEALSQLADSIAANGILQPILVRETGERYEIIAGERRFRAARLAGLSEIPALVLEADDLFALEIPLWQVMADFAAVHGVICGVSRPEQLAPDLAALEDPAPDAALCRELDDVWRSLPCDRFAYNR